mmetsp:Transcript_24771/g.76500  ORF Transcript_24771/g.76500 Transcript_24771/m.76500 type:complete len:222 (-) Transcript_24771:83-748(-)
MSLMEEQFGRINNNHSMIHVPATGKTSSCVVGATHAAQSMAALEHNTMRRAGAAPLAMAILKYSNCATHACSAMPKAKRAFDENTHAENTTPHARPVRTRDAKSFFAVAFFGATRRFRVSSRCVANVLSATHSSRKYDAYHDNGSFHRFSTTVRSSSAGSTWPFLVSACRSANQGGVWLERCESRSRSTSSCKKWTFSGGASSDDFCTVARRLSKTRRSGP